MSGGPIDFSGLTKPATVLAERICDAIQGGVRPWQIRRVAKAEGDGKITGAQADVQVALIEAEGALKVNEVQRRAITRFVDEQTQQQVNMEEIAALALGLVTEEAHPEDIELDWITNFFDKCRLTTDKEMRLLWAKLLAGEANAPGAFSKRTVTVLQSFDKPDATKFETLCRCVVKATEIEAIPLIYDFKHDVYAQVEIDFDVLQHLESVGLIHFEGVATFSSKHDQSTIVMKYFGEHAEIEVDFADAQNKYSIDLGHAHFTQIGLELSRLVNVKPIEGFFEYLLEYWDGMGDCVVNRL
jgi:hypothetical protein